MIKGIFKLLKRESKQKVESSEMIDADEFSMKLFSNREYLNFKQFGNLWHYGHFIHDLLMPLNDWLLKTGKDPKKMTLYIKDVPNQSIGPFGPILERFTGVKVKTIPAKAFGELPYEILELKAYMFGPFMPETFENLQTTIDRRFGIKFDPSQRKVILIERGASKHGFENSNRVHDRAKMVGKMRRSFQNHREIEQCLQSRYGDHFINVVLEGMPFEQQVEIFHHGHLIIGQHGAGLNNLAWKKENQGIILEFTPHSVHKPFENMSKTRGLTYRKYANPENVGEENESIDLHLNVDLEDFARVLDELESGDEVLRSLRV